MITQLLLAFLPLLGNKVLLEGVVFGFFMLLYLGILIMLVWGLYLLGVKIWNFIETRRNKR